MNNIEKLEKILNSHILFIYTNNDRTIDIPIIEEIYKHMEQLNDYDSINIVIHTKGGNLGVGYKIMHMLKEKYKEVNSIVLDVCASTGTFMALSSDNLFITPYAFVTPTEPKMDIYDEYNTNISTSNIRNLIEYNNAKELNPVILSNYLTMIKYFKDLCLGINDEEKANKIIEFNLNKVNSHYYPLTIDILNKMIKTKYIDDDIQDLLVKEHGKIIDIFNKKTTFYKPLTCIKSKNLISIEEKVYNEEKEKIKDGYRTIERKENKMKDNKRINDILSEEQEEKKSSYGDAYLDSKYYDKYRDSYMDSQYHDTYRDHYGYYDSYHDSYHDTYHDKYHDSYHDASIVEEKSKKLTKKRK